MTTGVPAWRRWPNIPAVGREAAARFAEAEAVVDGPRRYSYDRLWSDATEAARAFMGAGVRPRDRVAIWAPNSYAWVVSLLGLQSAGAAVVPLNTRLRSREAAQILNRSRAKMLVTVGDFLGVDYPALLENEALPHLERLVVLADAGAKSHGDPGHVHGETLTPSPITPWPDFLRLGKGISKREVDACIDAVAPDDVSDVIFTSGTTGEPKGILATHAQSIRTFLEWSRIVGLAKGDRYLLVNPMFHTFGYKAGILACLMTGATMLPLAVFDTADVLSVIAGEGVSVLPGPPTLYQSLLNDPRLAATDLSTLRLAVTGAAVIPVDLVRHMRHVLGFEVVLTAYGLTEATGFVTATRPEDTLETIATTSGRAIDGVEVRIVAPGGEVLAPGTPGEVVCRGFNVTPGYLGEGGEMLPATDAGGWLHTGDVGVLDERGNLRITDRLKDMFIVGGFNAYPAEIEGLLLGHPAIAQVAVVGAPDERLGEVGVAFVVPAAGQEVDPAEVMAWAREHMANYKAPRRVHVVDALPLNAGGKVMKTALRARA